MADKKISQLTAATTPLAGTEVLPVVQSGSTVKVAVSDLTAGRTASFAGTNITGGGTTRMYRPDNAIYTDISYQTAANGGLVINDANGSGFSFQFGGVNVVKIDANENLVISKAAKGIDFSANTHAAGMTSTLLNWYEEGTWTPVLRFGGGSTAITYTTQQGRYTRVGRTVTIRFEILLSNKGSSSGEADITGLPFNAANLNALSVYLYSGFDATYKVGIAYLNAGTINEIAANGTAAFSDAQFTNTSRFWGTCTYQV
jgi:hypothetical protein